MYFYRIDRINEVEEALEDKRFFWLFFLSRLKNDNMFETKETFRDK